MRRWRYRLVALLWLVGAVASAEPQGSGRVLRASAHHAHGNRGPLTPTSPVGQGVYRIGGYRVFDASAVHPFAVGFYDCTESGIETVSVLVGRRGGHFAREIAADVPLAKGCDP